MSTDRFELIVRGGTCVTSKESGLADVGVRGGLIAAVGDLANAEADTVFDATGLHVMAGVIDSQVHFREPGGEHKEDLATGTAAAVLGGVTAVFEMPNTSPPTTTSQALADKVARLADRARCDVGFYAGASADNLDSLDGLERQPGCVGIKIFMGSSTGSLLVSEDESVRRALSSGSRRVAVHSEDEDRLNERKSLLAEVDDVHNHPVWRDEECATRCTKRLIRLSKETGRRVHVLHVTTVAEMALLADQKPRMSVETTPQHLTFEAPEVYDRLGTYAQMNPPIREGQVEGLWRALADGVVDVIGSDHAPHTHEEKARPYPKSPSGMPGVQTILPVMLDHVHAGRLSLARLVELLCENPARLFGAQGKGTLDVGTDADLTLVDLAASRVIENDWIASRCGWTPFAGRQVTGWPRATVVRGHVVMREDEVLGDPLGRAIRFAGPAS